MKRKTGKYNVTLDGELLRNWSMRKKAAYQHLRTKKEVEAQVEIRKQAAKNLRELKTRLRENSGLSPETQERILNEKTIGYPNLDPNKVMLTPRERKLVAKLASKPFMLAHGTNHLKTIKANGNTLKSVRERKRHAKYPNDVKSRTRDDTGNNDTVFMGYQFAAEYIDVKHVIKVDLSKIIEKDPLQANMFWSSDVFYAHHAQQTMQPIKFGNTILQISYRINGNNENVKVFEYQLPDGSTQTEIFERGGEVAFGANIPAFRFHRIIEQLRHLDNEYREYILNNIDNDEIIDEMVRGLTLVRGFEIHKTAKHELSNPYTSVDIKKTDNSMNNKLLDYLDYRDLRNLNTHELKEFLEKNSVDLNYRNNWDTAILKAIRGRNYGIVKLLLETSQKKKNHQVAYPINNFYQQNGNEGRPLLVAHSINCIKTGLLLLEAGCHHNQNDLKKIKRKWQNSEWGFISSYFLLKHQAQHIKDMNPFKVELIRLAQRVERVSSLALYVLDTHFTVQKYLDKHQLNKLLQNSYRYIVETLDISSHPLITLINLIPHIRQSYLDANINKNTYEMTIRFATEKALERLNEHGDFGPLRQLLKVCPQRALIQKEIKNNSLIPLLQDYSIIEQLPDLKDNFAGAINKNKKKYTTKEMLTAQIHYAIYENNSESLQATLRDTKIDFNSIIMALPNSAAYNLYNMGFLSYDLEQITDEAKVHVLCGAINHERENSVYLFDREITVEKIPFDLLVKFHKPLSETLLDDCEFFDDIKREKTELSKWLPDVELHDRLITAIAATRYEHTEDKAQYYSIIIETVMSFAKQNKIEKLQNLIKLFSQDEIKTIINSLSTEQLFILTSNEDALSSLLFIMDTIKEKADYPNWNDANSFESALNMIVFLNDKNAMSQLSSDKPHLDCISEKNAFALVNMGFLNTEVTKHLKTHIFHKAWMYATKNNLIIDNKNVSINEIPFHILNALYAKPYNAFSERPALFDQIDIIKSDLLEDLSSHNKHFNKLLHAIAAIKLRHSGGKSIYHSAVSLIILDLIKEKDFQSIVKVFDILDQQDIELIVKDLKVQSLLSLTANNKIFDKLSFMTRNLKQKIKYPNCDTRDAYLGMLNIATHTNDRDIALRLLNQTNRYPRFINAETAFKLLHMDLIHEVTDSSVQQIILRSACEFANENNLTIDNNLIHEDSIPLKRLFSLQDILPNVLTRYPDIYNEFDHTRHELFKFLHNNDDSINQLSKAILTIRKQFIETNNKHIDTMNNVIQRLLSEDNFYAIKKLFEMVGYDNIKKIIPDISHQNLIGLTANDDMLDKLSDATDVLKRKINFPSHKDQESLKSVANIIKLTNDRESAVDLLKNPELKLELIRPDIAFDLFNMDIMQEEIPEKTKTHLLLQASEHAIKNKIKLNNDSIDHVSEDILVTNCQAINRAIASDNNRFARIHKVYTNIWMFGGSDEKMISMLTKDFLKHTDDDDIFTYIENLQEKEKPDFVELFELKKASWSDEQIVNLKMLKSYAKTTGVDLAGIKPKDIDELVTIARDLDLSNMYRALDYKILTTQNLSHEDAMFYLNPTAKNYYDSLHTSTKVLGLIFLNIFLLAVAPIVFKVAVEKQKKRLKSEDAIVDKRRLGADLYAKPKTKSEQLLNPNTEINPALKPDQQSPHCRTVVTKLEKVDDDNHPLAAAF